MGVKTDSAEVTVRRARVAEPAVRALIEQHHALMRATSPEDSCHVMEADALETAGAVLVVAERAGEVLGIGAFTDLGDGHAEVKSMHTRAAARGQGIGQLILRDVMARARQAGCTRVSLETGSAPEFRAARALYEANGFSYCTPFGAYVEDPLSVFMTRAL